MRYPKEYQAQERIEARKDLQLIEKMMKVNFAFLCAGLHFFLELCNITLHLQGNRQAG